MQNVAAGKRSFMALSRPVGLAVVIGLLGYWLGAGLLRTLDLGASDVLFLLRGQSNEPIHTVIVAIDDPSFAQSGLRWPWPRSYLARIVDNIAAGSPKAIAIDVFLYEASTAEEDSALAESIRKAGNVVMVNDISSETQGGIVMRRVNRPIPELDSAVASLGLTNFPLDEDGTVRRLLAFQSLDKQLYYSWAMQVSRLYLGEEGFNVVSANQVNIGDMSVELQSQYLFVNFHGPTDTIPTYSAYQVADSLVDPSLFEGKIVLLGATSESLHDSYPTPYGSQPPMPGVEINAHAIDTILNRGFITRTGWLTQLGLALLLAAVGVAIATRLRPVPAVGATLLVIVVYLALCITIFIGARVTLPIIGPFLGVAIAFVVQISLQLYDEQRKRAEVRSLFERYVAPAAIDQMLDQPETYAQGGQRRELTVLFSDIRGFTTLSEGLEPDEVVSILNAYLSTMTELIFKYEGTIDKFEGDAILAIWNAPLPVSDHAAKAVRCAIEMIERLNELQEAWAQKSHDPLRIGVGVNSGQAFVGNIGSTRRMDYTVIGDTVNLASRLQDLTKAEGVPILFSEATRDLLSKDIETRFVTTATVKGRAQAVNVYTIIDKTS